MEEITPIEAMAYEDAILAAIAKENRFFENDRGLAEYIHDESLNKNVHSLYPSVEICDGELQRRIRAAPHQKYSPGGPRPRKRGELTTMHIVRYYGLRMGKLWSGASILTLRKLQEYWPSKIV